MPTTRRNFLTLSISASMAALALPSLSEFSLFDDQVEAAAGNFIANLSGNPFIARASDLVDDEQRIRTSTDATSELFDRFGLQKGINQRPDLRDAGGCTPNLSEDIESLRGMGYHYFTPAKRLKADRNLVMLGAFQTSSLTNGKAAISMQYHGSKSVILKEGDPSAVNAAASFVEKFWKFKEGQLVNTVAVTEIKKDVVVTDRAGVKYRFRKLVNPQRESFILYLPTKIDVYDAGVVGIHVPGYTSPENIKWIGLKKS